MGSQIGKALRAPRDATGSFFFLTLDGRGSLVKHLGPDSWRSRRAASAPKRVDVTCRVGGPLEHCSVCLPAGHLHTKRKHCVSDLKCTNCRVEANVMQRFSVQQHTNESVLDEMIMHQTGDRSFDCLTMVFCCSLSSSASIGSFGLRQRSCSDLRSTQRRRYHLLPEATTKKHCGQLWVSPSPVVLWPCHFSRLLEPGTLRERPKEKVNNWPAYLDAMTGKHDTRTRATPMCPQDSCIPHTSRSTDAPREKNQTSLANGVLR